jgi:hypothetical protein
VQKYAGFALLLSRRVCSWISVELEFQRGWAWCSRTYNLARAQPNATTSKWGTQLCKKKIPLRNAQGTLGLSSIGSHLAATRLEWAKGRRGTCEPRRCIVYNSARPVESMTAHVLTCVERLSTKKQTFQARLNSLPDGGCRPAFQAALSICSIRHTIVLEQVALIGVFSRGMDLGD